MNTKLTTLEERRIALINKVADQRLELSKAVSRLHAPMIIADSGLNALRYVSRHPLLLSGVVLLATVWRPSRWFKILKNGWLIWRISLAARQKSNAGHGS